MKDVNASQEMLVDLFERIESFFKRLESHTELKPSQAMTDMIVKIMVEVLSVLQHLIPQFDQRHTSDDRLKNWLNPTVNVLYSFSATLGEGVGLVSLSSLSSICTLIVIN